VSGEATAQPLPQRAPGLPIAVLASLVVAPLAWYCQLCAGYALASWPCFPRDHLISAPPPGYRWTEPLMILAMVAAVLSGLLALVISWNHLSQLRAVGTRATVDIAARRTRFLALWGVLLGAGFAVASALTAVAFALLPRCAA
jgi:hypothetical protein